MGAEGVTTKGWAATQVGGTVTVTGIVVTPSGGWVVRLVRAEPQGINPAELLLELDLEEPQGPATTAITEVPVEYSEEGGFDSVSVKGQTGSMPVGSA